MSSLEWHERAACAGMDTELFFPGSGRSTDRNAALRVCGECPVRSDCLELALKIEGAVRHAVRFGIFGGMTPEQRAIESDRREGITRCDECDTEIIFRPRQRLKMCGDCRQKRRQMQRRASYERRAAA